MRAIKVTKEMITAGEAVLDRACELAEMPPYFTVIGAAADVYTAMENQRRLANRARRDAILKMGDQTP